MTKISITMANSTNQSLQGQPLALIPPFFPPAVEPPLIDRDEVEFAAILAEAKQIDFNDPQYLDVSKDLEHRIHVIARRRGFSDETHHWLRVRTLKSLEN